jgi:V8-like Glu-specific endopeptidase
MSNSGKSTMSFSSSQYPYDTVVEITDTIGQDEFQGSGVLIGPNMVLTAAHVVWSTDGGSASNIEVTPGADDGTAPFGSSAVVGGTFNEVYDASGLISQQQSQLDFAILVLAIPFASIGDMTIGQNFAGGIVNVTGYPASAGGVMVNSVQAVTLDSNYALLDGTALGEGSSGGPVWIERPGNAPEVIGLVSSGAGAEGTFVQLTSADLTEIRQWEAADGVDVTSAASPAVPAPSTPPASSPVVLFTQLDAADNDVTTNITADSYSGPLSFLSHSDAYSYNGSDSVKVAAVNAVSPLISTGSGNDLLIGSSAGTSVLDGGSGLNIDQDGGNAHTTFVQNGYVPGATWDFLRNFHGADEDIMFGYIPGLSVLSFTASAGLGAVTGASVTLSPGNGGSEEVTFADTSLSALHGASAEIGGVPSLVLWT